jgi:hypothetical protein
MPRYSNYDSVGDLPSLSYGQFIVALAQRVVHYRAGDEFNAWITLFPLNASHRRFERTEPRVKNAAPFF